MGMTTDQREREMLRLKRVSERFQSLIAEFPTAREIELSGGYPNMPRERVLRIVAAELEGGR